MGTELSLLILIIQIISFLGNGHERKKEVRRHGRQGQGKVPTRDGQLGRRCSWWRQAQEEAEGPQRTQEGLVSNFPLEID